jgi:hypothetical protein
MLRKASALLATLVLPCITACFGQISWSNQSPAQITDDIWGVTYANGTFAAVTNQGNLLTSTDGLSWSSQTIDQGVWLESIAYGNGMWVVVGDGGTILVSSDLKTWVALQSGTTNRLNSVLYNGSIWLAVGEAVTILTSPDAVNWTASAASTGTSGFLRGITWIPGGLSPYIGLTLSDGTHRAAETGVFLVTGSAIGNNVPPYGNYSGGAVLEMLYAPSVSLVVTNYFPEGPNWIGGHENSAFAGAPYFPSPLEGIIFEGRTNNNLVAVGDNGYIAYNGGTFSAAPTVTYQGLTYGNGYWVAAGGQGTILTSMDGINWNTASSGTTSALLSAAYSPTLFRFVVTGAGGTILVSNSTPQPTPTPTPTLPPGPTPTPTPTPSPTPTLPPGPTPTPTPTPSPTPTLPPGPTPTPAPTPTPIPTPIQGVSTTRLINISVRAQVGTGEDILIPGFVIGGNGIETLLIRADGPALTQFGVTGVLAQPHLSVTNNMGRVVASNAGWGTNPNPDQLATVSNSVGAFALPSGSADCALLVSLPAGAYTAQVTGVNNSTGVALAEIYEVSWNGTRLVNISARAQVGTGANILVPGFVISGTGSEKLLIRGDGPSLTQFGVTGVLAQPTLAVYDSVASLIATNTGWSTNANAAQIGAAFTATGAFALPSGSADSASLLDLAPGSYTAEVSGLNNTTGTALVEVYEVPAPTPSP